MLLKLVFAFCLITNFTFASEDEGVIYDKYTGKPVTDEDLALFESKGITSKCTMRIKPCDASETRRTDGSCNNLKHPSMGTFLVPQERLLEANYPNGSHTRQCFLPARKVRTSTLTVGKTASEELTQACNAFGIFLFGDVGSVHDISYFLVNKTDCCEPGHMDDEMCTQIMIPEDDPVHRFSGIRCMNLTKPLDHQFLGCTKDTTPAPIAEATAVLDLSQVYNALNNGDKAVRAYKGGKLKAETDEDGNVWPASGDNPNHCLSNIAPKETRCFGEHGAGLFLQTMYTILLLRNHNYYAEKLAEVNPCWDDEKLFQKAKDLNIATYMLIAYEGWLPAVIGEKMLQEKGLTKESIREDNYDETKPPRALLEFLYIMRYFHITQESRAYKYDNQGNIIGNISQNEVVFRPGFMGVDDNLRGYMPNLFLQSGAAGQGNVDPDMAELGLPPHIQRSFDLPTSDLLKGCTMGVAPYIDYIRYYTGEEIKSWNDLKKYMTSEHIKMLKTVYPSVRDIHLLSGAWMSKNIEGGNAPVIVGNIIFDYAIRNMITDRHWMARRNRPGAYTDDQFEEVRKMNLAKLICTNGDGIPRVQRNAFKIISETNPLVDCSELPSMDFSHFAEC